uniref:PH domain-containing protein n=1 Tax=Spongospora subterranea TaxID=70186 RepID=A0A0H5QM08_9EUKA|eukprot:CRZ02391.1 hypothetical protein [Spongospora subterranea]
MDHELANSATGNFSCGDAESVLEPHDKSSRPLHLTRQPSSEQRCSILYKRSRKRSFLKNREWKPRLWILTGQRLLYFKGTQIRARGVLSLSLIDNIVSIGTDIDHDVNDRTGDTTGQFTIQYGDKIFELRASSHAEMCVWVDHICLNMANVLSGCNQTQNEPKPWRTRTFPAIGHRQTLPGDDFPVTARSGDVILFQTRGMRGSFVRGATSSRFDHIGLILKLKNGAIGVVESLGNTGVQIR